MNLDATVTNTFNSGIASDTKKELYNSLKNDDYPIGMFGMLSEEVMRQATPGTENVPSDWFANKMINAPDRIYEVGKYKQYRQLIGVGQVKNHIGDPDLNISSKKKYSMPNAAPNQDLSVLKHKKGH